MINLRSRYLSIPRRARLGLRHFPADTHLLDWLEASGIGFDVVTDEDLDAEGRRCSSRTRSS